MPSKKEIEKQIDGFPFDDYALAQQTCRELLGGGSETVSTLVAMVRDQFGDPQGVKPKYALHGVVHYACGDGRAEEQGLVAKTLAKELSADHSEELKAFVVRQLQLCGRDEEVPALAALLGNERLKNPVTQALQAIGTKKAQDALRRAQRQ